MKWRHELPPFDADAFSFLSRYPSSNARDLYPSQPRIYGDLNKFIH